MTLACPRPLSSLAPLGRGFCVHQRPWPRSVTSLRMARGVSLTLRGCLPPEARLWELSAGLGLSFGEFPSVAVRILFGCCSCPLFGQMGALGLDGDSWALCESPESLPPLCWWGDGPCSAWRLHRLGPARFVRCSPDPVTPLPHLGSAAEVPARSRS